MPENENLEQEEAVGDEPQYEYVTDPMMLDSTGQDIKDSIDGVSTALAALAGSIRPSANNVSFDNTGTGLTSSDVQSAIEELVLKRKVVTVTVASGQTGAQGTGVVRNKVISIIPIYSDDFFYDPVITTLTTNSEIEVRTTKGTAVTAQRSYSFDVIYINY